MKIQTTDADLAKCFSDGQITSTGATWLEREARKWVAWDFDAYRAFEDAYWDKANGSWSGDRINVLLTTEPLARTLALAMFLQRSGFPEGAATRVSELVIRALGLSPADSTVRTDLEVVFESAAPTGVDTATPATEVTLRGPMVEQMALFHAMGATTTNTDVTSVVQSACNFLVDQCTRDSDLRQTFLASDWAQGLASVDALRFAPQPGPAGRALVEVSLMVYLDRRGFGERAGDAAERLADAWAGQTPSFGAYTLKVGPPDEELTELPVTHAGGSL